jgi:D-alanyl-D-alanine carboxypeptidase
MKQHSASSRPGHSALALAALLLAGPAAAHDARLDALASSYKDKIARIDLNAIVFRDGTRMDAGAVDAKKPFDLLLQGATILDQFRLAYPGGTAQAPPARDFDPGRFRNEAFFTKLYGDCRKSEVERALVPVTWLPRSWGRRVKVTAANGVAEHLRAVSDEIDALPQHIRRAAFPIAGVYSCRPVKDTGRLSMHAYAAAIDLNLRYSNYWLWEKSGWHNRMPREIVGAFERHGFIWGGRWYHYDTMHFEYRPELLQKK